MLQEMTQRIDFRNIYISKAMLDNKNVKSWLLIGLQHSQPITGQVRKSLSPSSVRVPGIYTTPILPNGHGKF